MGLEAGRQPERSSYESEKYGVFGYREGLQAGTVANGRDQQELRPEKPLGAECHTQEFGEGEPGTRSGEECPSDGCVLVAACLACHGGPPMDACPARQ